jgi:hypothetical protein
MKKAPHRTISTSRGFFLVLLVPHQDFKFLKKQAACECGLSGDVCCKVALSSAANSNFPRHAIGEPENMTVSAKIQKRSACGIELLE